MTNLPAHPDVPIAPPAVPSGLTRLIGWYHRLTALSFPKRYPIIQFPNWPLILAFVAGQAAGRLHGMPHDDAQAISYLSMILWAYGELAHGVNRFRNLLGLVYVISTTVHLASALHG
jgi:hypothetical protein